MNLGISFEIEKKINSSIKINGDQYLQQNDFQRYNWNSIKVCNKAYVEQITISSAFL